MSAVLICRRDAVYATVVLTVCITLHVPVNSYYSYQTDAGCADSASSHGMHSGGILRSTP